MYINVMKFPTCIFYRRSCVCVSGSRVATQQLVHVHVVTPTTYHGGRLGRAGDEGSSPEGFEYFTSKGTVHWHVVSLVPVMYNNLSIACIYMYFVLPGTCTLF